MTVMSNVWCNNRSYSHAYVPSSLPCLTVQTGVSLFAQFYQLNTASSQLTCRLSRHVRVTWQTLTPLIVEAACRCCHSTPLCAYQSLLPPCTSPSIPSLRHVGHQRIHRPYRPRREQLHEMVKLHHPFTQRCWLLARDAMRCTDLADVTTPVDSQYLAHSLTPPTSPFSSPTRRSLYVSGSLSSTSIR